jgi:hypothetical protein
VSNSAFSNYAIQTRVVDRRVSQCGSSSGRCMRSIVVGRASCFERRFFALRPCSGGGRVPPSDPSWMSIEQSPHAGSDERRQRITGSRAAQLLPTMPVLHRGSRESREFLRKSGAGDGTRTRDLLITNQLLYQLSYAGVLAGQAPLSERPESRILAWPRRRILTDAPWPGRTRRSDGTRQPARRLRRARRRPPGR